MKKIRKIEVIFSLILAPSFFQDLQGQGALVSSGNQRFLWFTGHWSKDKENTFITTPYSDSAEGGVISMPGGNTVTVTTTGNLNINSKQVDAWNKKITDGESDLDKTENELKDPSNEIQEWASHFNKAAISQIDSIKTEWADYKINKNENPLNQDQDKASSSMQNITNNLTNWCRQHQAQYQAIMDFYEAHRHDSPSGYNNPPPPEFDFDCMACDTDLVKHHDEQVNDYAEKFFKPESDLIKNGLGMMRQLILIGRSDDVDNAPIAVSMDAGLVNKIEEAFHTDKSDPSKSGACAYFESYKLSSAVQFLVQRCLWRAEKLLKDNRKNFKAAMAVVRVYLEAARQNELMGFTVDERLADAGELVLQAYDYYYNKLVKEHDWSQLANVPFILSLSRQYTLLTGDETGTTDLVQLFKVLNSFELNIDMDIKSGKDGGYILAHLKGKAKVAPEFNYGAETCYGWVIVEDAPNKLGLPVKKGNQELEVDLLANQIITPKFQPKYTGTKKYWCTLEQLKMDYCHPGNDTILLTGFLPRPDVLAGTWVYPYDPHPVPAGINGLDHYFQDENKMKELAESGKAAQQAQAAKQQSEKLIAQMRSVQSQMGKPGTSQVGNYQKIQDLAIQSRQVFNSENSAPILYIDFPLQIQSNNVTLVNKRFDVKQVNPAVAEGIVYGYYTVDIEYKEE